MVKKSINCREVGLRLQSYLDGELDDMRMDQIRSHLDDCVACGLEADAFVNIKKEINAQSVPADSDALARLRSFSEQISENVAQR